MNKEQLLEKYIEELQTVQVDSVPEYLRKHEKENIFVDLLNYACNGLIEIIQRSYVKYDNNLLNNSVVKIFIEVVDMIKVEELSYYVALSEFFKGNNENVIRNLEVAAKYGFFCDDDAPMTDSEFSNCFIAPFKGGYGKMFWSEIYELLSKMNVERSVFDLCEATSIFYYSNSIEQVRETFEKIIEKYPNCIIAKEMLAINYYNSQKWGNAVAFFEQLDDEYYILFDADLYYYMAWCYGKLKETNNEIEYYKKSAEILPEGFSIMNNLGYAYYKAKQYTKALECFQKCLDNNWDVKYAANNYVRVLLSIKRFKDAKSFVKNSPVKIYKNLLERVKKAENTNKKIKADEPLEEILEPETATVEKGIDLGVKKQQFTSEKILEDELVLRMEMGLEVFGKQLKIFRRKGVYGRQYILSNGKRPDILAEDDNGNLYVIELKKDSGYDDAYVQTVEYLEWFDENRKDRVKNIYGIICLNSPSAELLKKVHNNPRIRVFEYQISYYER